MRGLRGGPGRDAGPRHQRALAEMADYFELEEGVAPDAARAPLEEVFHLE
ncbi:MAG: hypothetical protein ACXVRP_06320 [Solirubrobacteraceae bacterium]